MNRGFYILLPRKKFDIKRYVADSVFLFYHFFGLGRKVLLAINGKYIVDPYCDIPDYDIG
jgi:hypothetical protein